MLILLLVPGLMNVMDAVLFSEYILCMCVDTIYHKKKYPCVLITTFAALLGSFVVVANNDMSAADLVCNLTMWSLLVESYIICVCILVPFFLCCVPQ